MKNLIPLFNGLADEARLRILNLLFESGELCVCDIEATLGFTQTKVSRHMAYLKRAGLVRDRRQGRWILYSIAAPTSEHQRIIITSVRKILSLHAHGRKDSAKLRKRIEDGCCATFTRVKPHEPQVRFHSH